MMKLNIKAIILFLFFRFYSASHSKQQFHCERALFASEAVSQSIFSVQQEIASGKERPCNDSLNSNVFYYKVFCLESIAIYTILILWSKKKRGSYRLQ